MIDGLGTLIVVDQENLKFPVTTATIKGKEQERTV